MDKGRKNWVLVSGLNLRSHSGTSDLSRSVTLFGLPQELKTTVGQGGDSCLIIRQSDYPEWNGCDPNPHSLPVMSVVARSLTNLCEPQLLTWKMNKIIINLMKWLCNGLYRGLISLSKWGWNAGGGKKHIYWKLNGAVLFSQMYAIQFKADHSSGSAEHLAIVISQGY